MKKSKTVVSLLSLAAILFLAGQTGASVTGLTSVRSYREGTTSGKYTSDFASEADCLDYGNDLTTQIAEEGMILLKNKDNTLPLTGAKYVSVFGKSSVNPSLGGTGSGASKGYFKPVDVYSSLAKAGFKTNTSLKNFYEDNKRSGVGRVSGKSSDGFSATDIGESALSRYDDALKATFSAYSDAAIVVLTRIGGEGYDLIRNNSVDHQSAASGDEDYEAPEANQHYLKLSKNEREMIAMIKASQAFKKIVVVLNSSNAMELGELADDDAIGGILWAGGPGGTGFTALGEILNGSVNPSGHTVDIFPRDFTLDPSYSNFGDNTQTSTPDSTTGARADNSTMTYLKSGETTSSSTLNYIDYEEGIYVGYRYYETKADVLNADDTNHQAGTDWYEGTASAKGAVVYPFGYGLSYTTFSEAFSSDSTPSEAIQKDGTLTLKVIVTNTGSVSGKHVVQAYYKAPYLENGIEKASANLVGFAKTSLLKPGQSQTVDVSFKVQAMASYDDTDKNQDSHKGYELDKGDYEVSLRSNSHAIDTDNATDSQQTGSPLTRTFTLAETADYDNDGISTAKVSNLFTGTTEDSLPKSSDGIGFTAMTRAKATNGSRLILPEAPKANESALTDTGYQRLMVADSIETIEADGYAHQKTLSDIKTAYGDDYTQGDTTQTITFQDLAGLAYTDKKYDQALNKLTYHEMIAMINNSGWKTPAVPSLGKPQAAELDGPSAVYKVDYPVEATIAATYNRDLSKAFGRQIGNEELWANQPGWYGPAMNTHRSPFAGRNFEYYSEDGYLAGEMAAQTVSAAKAKGVICYVKHMATNDQETNRANLCSFVSEQALREVYFKPFRYAVEKGHANGVMASQTRIGMTACYNNYAEMQAMLRDEWGFDGYVVTDAGAGFKPGSTTADTYLSRIGGIDCPLAYTDNSEETLTKEYGDWDDTKKLPVLHTDSKDITLTTSYYAFRQSAKRFLYAFANSTNEQNAYAFDAFKGQDLVEACDFAFSEDISVQDPLKDIGTRNISYAVTSGSLPEGVTLTANGILSGKSAVKGKSTFEITCYADSWVKSTQKFSLTIADLFTSDQDLSDLTANKAVSATFSSDKVKPSHSETSMYGGYVTITTDVVLTFVLGEGSLPDGLTLSSDGVLSGTPTTAGTYDATLSIVELTTVTTVFGANKMVSNSANTYNQDLTITVKADSTAPVVDPAKEAGEKADSAASAAANATSAANAAASAAQAASSTATAALAASEKKSSYQPLMIGGIVLGSAGLVVATVGLILVLLKKKD
ncbi:MAG: glycoside hydrolase family 3 C-terminal domain-containing protein [Bacilli bacterium]|jgi:beta-glucosidase|nr:glycoside hydrolase family 3 C-terminal domain-containing protein [Bacilli bacterium]